MPRLHFTAAALTILALAAPGCSRNRDIPSQLAPSRTTSIGVNSYLWRAAIDTVSFAPLLQADSNGGVIVTEWYRTPTRKHGPVTGAIRIRTARDALESPRRARPCRTAIGSMRRLRPPPSRNWKTSS